VGFGGTTSHLPFLGGGNFFVLRTTLLEEGGRRKIILYKGGGLFLQTQRAFGGKVRKVFVRKEKGGEGLTGEIKDGDLPEGANTQTFIHPPKWKRYPMPKMRGKTYSWRREGR